MLGLLVLKFPIKPENLKLLFLSCIGRESVVKLLIDHGADANKLNNFNNTALILAIVEGDSSENYSL